MRIVPADGGDVDALADLWVRLAADQRRYDSHLLAEPNRTTIREALAQHVAVDGVRVARPDPDADAVVGFVMFGLETGRYEQDVTRGIVHNLFVEASHRGEGVGGALLDAAERRLAESGADVVALDVMVSNADARRFYERRGYDPHRIELERSLSPPSDGGDGDRGTERPVDEAERPVDGAERPVDGAGRRPPKSDTHSREDG